MNMRKKMMNVGIAMIIVFLVFPGEKVFSWPWTKGNITGSVHDENDSTRMLEGVRIFLVEEELSTSTDAYGGFLIKDIRAGIHTLTFEKQGFLKETTKVQIKKNETLQLPAIGLKRAKGIYSLDRWSELAAAHMVKALKQSGLKKFRIAIGFYLKSGSSTCELKDLTLKFTNKLNSLISKQKIEIVVRDRKDVELLGKEIALQLAKQNSFDPLTLVRLGKHKGANVMIIGALIEKLKYFEPLTNAVLIEENTLIQGASIDYFLKKGEARCD